MKTCSRCKRPLGWGGTCAHCDRAPEPGGATRRPGGAEQSAPGAAGLHEAWLWQPSKIGKRQPTSRTPREGERHFLVPPFGQWITLDARAGAAFVLGRDASCEVRIRSRTVSRRHARIRFDGSPLRAHVSDLGTVNRTRVNGALFEGDKRLAPGDTIRVGDVTAIYRVLEPGVPEGTLENQTDPAMLDKTIPLPASGASFRPISSDLSGEMAVLPASEVLGRLKSYQANGTFVVDVDGLEGLVSFDQGNVHQASLGELTGRAALDAISGLRRGRFRFVPHARKVQEPGRARDVLNSTPPQGAGARDG